MGHADSGAVPPRRFTIRLKNTRTEQTELNLVFAETRSLLFNESKAYILFKEIARRYCEGIGFYHGVRQIQPQHLYTPRVLKEKGGRELANFFFFLAMSQRGGLNSDDSIRLTNALWQAHPELFDPATAAALSAEKIRRMIQGVAERFYANGLNGEHNRRAGALSFKLHEFAEHWRLNASVLAKCWGLDIRNVFATPRTFEEYFQLVNRGSNWERNPSEPKPGENPAAFYGMRRKIFALLVFWLIEFKLIQEFRIPLVVDFHVMRVLLEQAVIIPKWKKLGSGSPKIQARLRPQPLWDYESVHVHEQFVNQIIAWSYEFLSRHNLSPFDVHNGLWNLSRVLCAAYYGNSCTTIKREDETGKTHAITARLPNPAKLVSPAGWPKGYRDLCRFCPLEDTCEIAVPSGPYYDWGVMVRSGEHVVYPARNTTLDGVLWYDLPLVATRRRNNIPAELSVEAAKSPRTEKDAKQMLLGV